LAELDFTVVHKPGKTIGHADALSRLPQESQLTLLTTEVDSSGKIFVPTEDREEILHQYHDSSHSGGHDGIWRTYMKISKRFRWPNLRSDVKAYVKSCLLCQRNKAKFRQKVDRLCLRSNDVPPMHTIHVDFAELTKASKHGSKTRAFVVAIDRNTRFAVAKAGKEDARAVVTLLSQRVFKDTKVVVSDHAKVFESRHLKNWAAEKGIELQVGSPFHQQSNGLVERLIRDLKTFISMYPDMRGGWRCALEAAVKHHNRSRCSTIGCSPHFALNKEAPFLPADFRFGVERKIRLTERRFSVDEEFQKRLVQKKAYDSRHQSQVPQIAVGDLVLVRKGSGKQCAYDGPFEVRDVQIIEDIPKRITYKQGTETKTAALRNVLKYCPRGGSFQGGSVGDSSSMSI
jgi:transposase InsO family protein